MPKITELSQLDLNQAYSFDEHVELIKGKVMQILPTSNVRHQEVSGHLVVLLYDFLKQQKRDFFAAPFDVRLYDRKKSILASKDIRTVVQPDLCVICKPELLDERGCNGAPDWIIEILPPGEFQAGNEG